MDLIKPNSSNKLFRWLYKNSLVKSKKLKNQNKETTNVSLAGGVYFPYPLPEVLKL